MQPLAPAPVIPRSAPPSRSILMLTEQDNSTILATYDTANFLRVYRVRVNWNVPTDFKDNQAAQLNPSLEVTAILSQDSSIPITIASADTPSATNLEPLQRIQLTHLDISPVAPENRTHNPTYPTVMATFALLPPASSVQLLDSSQQYRHATAVICRWQVRTGATNSLSSCFDQLTQKKKSTSAAKPQVSLSS